MTNVAIVHKRLSELKLDVVDAALDAHRYVVVRDVDFEAVCAEARGEYDQAFCGLTSHPPRELFSYQDLANGPWRKLAIGSKNGVGEAYAQVLQTTYFQWNTKAFPGMAKMFRAMIDVRNMLTRVSPSFGSDPVRDGFWNACRIHHYPRGGGFMSTHKDTHFPIKLGDKPYYQVAALLSRKGRDFNSGGGVIYDAEDTKVDLETDGGFGSLVIFDGRAFHGVEEVDPDCLIDFGRLDGRLAAFTGFYVTRQAP